MGDPRLSEWQLHGVRILHDDVVRIEEHDVETPEGRRYAFPIVRSPGFAKVVPIMDNGDVVLVRQYRYAVGGETLEVPAGAIDDGEEPIETARRELSEEALVTSDHLEPLGEFTTSPGRMDERGYVFLARNCRPDPTAVQHEPTLPLHMPLDDAIALIGGEVLAATSSLALLLAQRRLAGDDR
jgi:ADP-ribose pyrophosphatase